MEPWSNLVCRPMSPARRLFYGSAQLQKEARPTKRAKSPAGMGGLNKVPELHTHTILGLIAEPHPPPSPMESGNCGNRSLECVGGVR
jgi:hypothetical protein